MAVLVVCLLAASPPGAATGERRAQLLEPRPSDRDLLIRTLLVPVSVVGGVATGVAIGLGIGGASGLVADLIATRAAPFSFVHTPMLLMVGAAIGGTVGYLMGTIGPGHLFEEALSARKRAVLIGAIVTAVVGGVWLGFLIAGLLPVVLPWLIVGSVAAPFIVPLLSDATRPRADTVALVAF